MLNLIPFSTKEPDVFDYFDAFEPFFRAPQVPEFAQFRTDICEKDQNYLLSAELPGFNKEDIKIDLKDDILTISASHSDTSSKEETTKEKDEKEPTVNYIRRERKSCSYKRSFNVEGIDTKNIKASYNNGILELTLPKVTPKEPERITIDVA